MNINEFWELIDKTRIESENNPIQQAKLLEDALFAIPIEEIVNRTFNFWGDTNIKRP